MQFKPLGDYLGMILLFGVLCGCAPLKPYHVVKANGETGDTAGSPTACYEPLGDMPRNACVRFVEYDDFGNLFNPRQLNETVEAARKVAEGGGIVVVYVHGWEHNANPGDSDLKSFHQAMQNAHALDRKYNDNRTILGIYVGWRGQSLRVPGLSKLSFWERKTTAQSVGDGAVYELFRKLANHRESYKHSRLVLVGHSFGGAVTYSSVSHSIMEQIIGDPPENTRGEGRSTRNEAKRWDMVVLINPAFEAMQLRPHLDLARSRDYRANQLPHLILVTSEADWATGKAFPVGRYLRSTLNKYADEQSADMYRTAVGHYIPFVTHQLVVKPDCAQFLKNTAKPVAPDKLGEVVEAKYTCFNDNRAFLFKEGDERKPQPVMWTRCDAAGDCAEVAGQHAMRAPRHMPILNIRTTAGVMGGHNDIWNPTMQAFLVQLMVYIVERPGPAAPPG